MELLINWHIILEKRLKLAISGSLDSVTTYSCQYPYDENNPKAKVGGKMHYFNVIKDSWFVSIALPCETDYRSMSY